ncbi:hypothetical protein ACIA59_20140 [Micromonospora haikouensis]|uniref:phage tail tube protein n=1 Tax=Micromonospora haikouensis TaxID=686309 RepID=UPI0037A7FAED
MAQRHKGQLALGPGMLRIAPLGSPEPTDLVTPWDPAWTEMGYTAEGSKFSYEIETGTVVPAEEIDPIHVAINGRNLKVAFALLQLTAANLKIAMTGGTITAGSGFVTFEPHAAGEEERVMLGHESEDGTERWVWRECLQGGNVELDRKKGSDAVQLGSEFILAKPDAGTLPFKSILAAPTRA